MPVEQNFDYIKKDNESSGEQVVIPPFQPNSEVGKVEQTVSPVAYQNLEIDKDQRTTIPVIHEQLKVEKKVVETAKVNVSKVVYEDVESYKIPYLEEHVSVERFPKNEIVDTVPPGIRYEGDVMIIPVLKEVAVVEKRIMLVEEIHVTKFKTEKTVTHEVALRKEEIEIKRTEINNP